MTEEKCYYCGCSGTYGKELELRRLRTGETRLACRKTDICDERAALLSVRPDLEEVDDDNN